MSRISCRSSLSLRNAWACGLFAILAVCWSSQLCAQPLVPGTGHRWTKIGDDFEDPKWAYNFNNPKASDENDKQQRLPAGAAVNGRLFEGVMRGQPDLIQRVETPEGGIPGSTGALLLRSKQTGVPGSYSGHFQQDDLIVDVLSRIGGYVMVSRAPSCTVRVYVPPFDQWEKRPGPSFGFRAANQAFKTREGKGRRSKPTTKLENYWPGFFIHYVAPDKAHPDGSAMFTVRSGPLGQDLAGPRITEPGWWTLGMSFTPDGMIHFFAHQGVEDLTSADHITSQYPYGMRAERFETFFFNVVSGDNGNWSTPWIIDEAAFFTAR